MPAAMPPLHLRESERNTLRALVRRPSTSQALAPRASITLAAAEGHSNSETADGLDVNRVAAGNWRRRFAELGIDGIGDAPRPGAPRTVTDDDVDRVVAKTLESAPTRGARRTTRTVAGATGLSQSTVAQIWREVSLELHRTEIFNLSNDPFFVDKVRDIAGLNVDSPDKALVLCVDEKSRIQAMERTQPLLPMRPGVPERRTCNNVRHGTTTLFAALDRASERVIGTCFRKHRAANLIGFFRLIEEATLSDLDLHLILDRYATHKAAAVCRWLARKPRFHVHFTPTSSSWINLVESWFSVITRQAIRRGSHGWTR